MSVYIFADTTLYAMHTNTCFAFTMMSYFYYPYAFTIMSYFIINSIVERFFWFSFGEDYKVMLICNAQNKFYL